MSDFNNISRIREAITLKSLSFLVFLTSYLILLIFIISGYAVSFRKEMLFLAFILSSIFIFHKKFRPYYAIITFSGILFFLAGEIYFRIHYFGLDGILHFTQYTNANFYDSFVPFEKGQKTYSGLRPHQKTIFKGGEVYINNLGFRDNDRVVYKEKGVIRIAVCGGSISFGTGVKQDKYYSAVLERDLKAFYKSENFEVMNFSVPGSGPQDRIDVVKEFAIPFDSDIILFHPSFLYRERKMLWKNLRWSRAERIKDIFKYPASIFFFSNLLYEEMKQKNINKKLKSENELQEETAVVENRVKAVIKELKDISSERKVFILPIEDMSNMGLAGREGKLYERLSGQYGLEYIHTSEMDFQKATSRMTIYPGDSHLDSRVHRIFADIIFRSIKPEIDELLKKKAT